MHNHAYAQHKRSSLYMYAQHSKGNSFFISSAYTQKVYALLYKISKLTLIYLKKLKFKTFLLGLSNGLESNLEQFFSLISQKCAMHTCKELFALK
jgi:hypothetical protein